MPKVVAISNFSDPEISDILICENATQQNAKKIADFFNASYGEKHIYHFTVKNDGYILYEGVKESP